MSVNIKFRRTIVLATSAALAVVSFTANVLAAQAPAPGPLHILYLGEIASPPAGGARGGRGGVIASLSNEQNGAVAAMNTAVSALTTNATQALNDLRNASFPDTPDPAGLKTKIDALAAAELALATRRATEFSAIQASPNRLNATQLYYVFSSLRGQATPPAYTFLPGQTLAPEGIYFDHLTSVAGLTSAYLQHFDAAIVALPSSQIDAAHQQLLNQFRASGHNIQTVTVLPSDEQIRSGLESLVGPTAMTSYRAFLSGRQPVKYEKKDGVANYERRQENLPVPGILSAQESMKHVQVPADFELQLFASEPEIGRPISFAWDERGRLWVVEAVDYPHNLYLTNGSPTGEGHDQIKICEDTNGDGRADKFTVFADKLNMATSLTFVNGGIMVSALRNLVFLKDTNGDDKADVRTVIFPNSFGTGDTHAMEANLSRGFDNWLYGTVGYSRFTGMVNGANLNFAQGVYRFKADGSAMEFLHQFSNNTWGFGQNAAGDVFGSTANGAPTFYGGIPANALPTGLTAAAGVARGGGAGGARGGAAGTSVMTAQSLAQQIRMHPNTPNVRQVDQMGSYTAASNHRFILSDAMPARLQGASLVCEPTCKIVGMFHYEPNGAGYLAKDGFNLVASSDEWMSPVYAEVGPDGAVWVADFQNFIIQHNPTPNLANAGYQSSNGPGGAHTSPLRENHYGRVYRVVWKDGPATPIKSLGGASTAAIVAALDSGNIFWRQTAQRLIVDNKKTDSVPALKAMVKEKVGRPGAIHALWALEGLGALDRDTHRGALLAKDSPLRRNAVRALESTAAGSKLFFESGVVNDPDLQTRLAAFAKLAQFPTTPEIKTVVTQLRKDPKNMADEWLGAANAGLMFVRAHQVPDAELDAPAPALVAGDPKNGEALFRSAETAACIACHTVGGSGGTVGPALDGIAARKDAAYIRESVTEPNAKLAEGYQQLEQSPMPPMALLLKPQQVEDIISFLLTLKTPAPAR